ncbi:MAG: excinuclease ABC subunit UvrA [Myxococcales bacterium]
MLPIRLRHARTHNLRNVSLDLPPGQLVALTGPSGSGKSSLALDTLYAEGQRRFIESFSPYARQFLERLERPPMDSLDPIAATIAVDRRAPVKSNRSTLATIADLEPYLAGLFAREAIPRCPDCNVDAVNVSPRVAAERAAASFAGLRGLVSYPVRAEDAEAFLELRETLAQDGYRRLFVAGRLRELDEVRPSEASAPGVGLQVVVDRVAVGPESLPRLIEAIEVAWKRGDGRAELRGESATDGPRVTIARGLVCPSCARAFDPARAALFSYNSPLGACESCRGFGRVIGVDWNKVVPDPQETLEGGAIRPWSTAKTTRERNELVEFCGRKSIPMDIPWARLTAKQRAFILHGDGDWNSGAFPGVSGWFKWLEGRTYKMHIRVFLARYREYTQCDKCGGARLNPRALTYRVASKNLAEWHMLTVADARDCLASLTSKDPQGARIVTELSTRLAYLDDVGLGYLSLDRAGRTLSGGEAQRAALTTALGASLTGTLFVLDEPTVGLHPSDIAPLARVLRELAQSGNGVLVIEHDPLIVQSADRVLELGPGAGKSGGNLLFDGPPAELAKRHDLPTARAWRRALEKAPPRRAPKDFLTVRGATANNLQHLDVSIPLGVLVAITGPSGSGKSTLAEDIVYRAVAHALATGETERPGAHTALVGASSLAGAVLVDQTPLGRTTRGNAATYTKAWDRIRALFAAEPEARQGYLSARHFSFNVTGGRCLACSGDGYETVEMQFLADVSVLCPVCQGKRFRPEVLAIRHRGVNVAELLDLTIEEAFSRLDAIHDRALHNALKPLLSLGLGYLPLGQPLSTLSGGEAQRLKLARALAEQPKRTLFVLDEPSAGLHPEDTLQVLVALNELVSSGATVLVVEHDLQMVRAADWVIDLGPGAGPHGGLLVAQGTPEQLAAANTKTGRALRGELSIKAADRAPVRPPLNAITVEHAREHNLKDISLAIPHSALTVVTGASGSGKSSLAFDVVFAEGQRRFLETLTPYARQFLPTLPRPDVDRVLGVPPSIALEQRTARAGANSTVATVTEVAHYLRLLYAKVGDIFCPRCDVPVSPLVPDVLFSQLAKRPGVATLYAPVVRQRKGAHVEVFAAASRAAIAHARVDGQLVATASPPRLAKTKEHSIDLVIFVGELAGLRRETFDHALAKGAGVLRVAGGHPKANGKEELFSVERSCTSCGMGVPELDPRWFSFNTKQGQCEGCGGTGIDGGAKAIEEGIRRICEYCEGTRLGPVQRRVRLAGDTYPEFMACDAAAALARARAWRFEGSRAVLAEAAHAELLRRLAFVEEVGLGYLGLGRPASTLSGGEMQRLRLSAQLGSGLTGALYVLDEPTIGLHPRDTYRLLGNLRKLVATGSTVLVVEHDAETIRAADHLIDLGPGGGRNGGHVIAQGPARDVLRDPNSPTAQALAATARVQRPVRPVASAWLELTGAQAHNLKDATLRVPVGRLTVVAGVSGSGKSTLVRQVFYPALRRALGLVADEPGTFRELRGHEAVRRALAVDQSPIGRTPRSVPATFLGVWNDVRTLFASLPEAKMRGYTANRFSFNSAAGGGRCPACTGQGVTVAEMSFLPEVVTPCEDCGGSRFEPQTLEIRYSGLSIGDVLHLSAEDAAEVFTNHRRIKRPLSTLHDLGVGYVSIGQGSNSLSGGEAQRLKLAAELTAGSAHEATVYVLDEPTTGLHLSDVRRLLQVLERLVERGDTVVVIEHHPDVIASADWVVELGPEAGALGGQVVFAGAPSLLTQAKTATGLFLASASHVPLR